MTRPQLVGFACLAKRITCRLPTRLEYLLVEALGRLLEVALCDVLGSESLYVRSRMGNLSKLCGPIIMLAKGRPS